MSLASLAALSRDEAPSVGDVDEVRVDKGAASSGDAPSGIKPMGMGARRGVGNRSTGSSEPLEDDTDWEATGLAMPESGGTPKSPNGDIEASLLASGVVGDALASADLDSSPASVSRASDSTSESETEAEPSPDGVPEGMATEKEAESMDEADPVLVQMLGILHGDERALRDALEFKRIRQEAHDKLRGLDLDERALREEMARADREAGRQVAGGGLGISSLLGRMFKAGFGKDARIDGIGRQRRRAVEEYSGAQAAFRGRLAEYIRERYPRDVFETRSQAEALARSIHAYNQAFLDSEGAETFRGMVEAEASRSGKTPLQILDELGGGGGGDDLRAELARARVAAEGDERIEKAAAVMAEEQDLFERKFKRTVEDLDVLAKNGDPEVAEKPDQILNSLEALEAEMPNPVADEERAREFRERMERLRDSIKEAVEAIIARIMGGLGLKAS